MLDSWPLSPLLHSGEWLGEEGSRYSWCSRRGRLSMWGKKGGKWKVVSRNINPNFHNITTVENDTMKRSGKNKPILLVESKTLSCIWLVLFVLLFGKTSKGKALLFFCRSSGGWLWVFRFIKMWKRRGLLLSLSSGRHASKLTEFSALWPWILFLTLLFADLLQWSYGICFFREERVGRRLLLKGAPTESLTEEIHLYVALPVLVWGAPLKV